jgi:cytochrome c peroxidase
LGQRLFFEPRLSPDGRLACASCHVPGLAFTDGRPRAQGRDLGSGDALNRNTPTLLNAAQQRWLGWDGAFDSLWSQAIHPLLNPREMAATPTHLQALLRDDPTLACQWRRAHGAPPPDDAEATLVLLAKALGAFVGTLHSGRTPFDDFRDALARGDRRAAARYPLAAQRGLRLFVGRGQCTTCHGGPLLSNGEFGDIGAAFFVRPGVVDPGRHAGITALRASRFNLLGPFSDANADTTGDEVARKTRHVELQHRNFGEFKVPSLRNLVHTAPYLHDGQLAALAAVVEHYSTLSPDRLHADGEQILKPLHLSAGERADLVAFLQSLASPGATAWQPAVDRACTTTAERARMR